MNNIPSIIADLEKVKDLSPSVCNIPINLKEDLCEKWAKCASVNASGVRVSTHNNSEVIKNDFSNLNIIKAVYARKLAKSLLEYKEHLTRLLSLLQLSQEEKKELNAKTSIENSPSWWPRFLDILQKDYVLEDEDKENLKLFALDKNWSGCTKGVSRGDFLHSSICNSVGANVTHDSMIGVAAKEFIDIDTCQQIEDWHTEYLSGYSGNGSDLLSILQTYISGYTICPLFSGLSSKPFAILTGSSGTGKTKEAENLCKYYSNQNSDNRAIVAVGADWTDNRNTLGFVNHLQRDGQNQPVYQSTEILNLLIRANADSSFPYFLILDEMNLSHVERYFADFLSVMEQKDGQFHLHDEGAELTNSATGEQKVPNKLPYPENLFVIGTVNIDETTYMFSPKVLDRANVIEFKVAKDDLENFLKDPHECAEVEKAAPGQAEAFLAIAKKARANDLPKIDTDVSKKLNDHLLQLFSIMQQGRFEFAYRTANEITRYMRVSQYQLFDADKELNDAEKANQKIWSDAIWEDSFDQQIVQKILPKLHGSIGRVGKLIARLAHFCHTPKDPDQLNDSLMEAAKLDANSAKFKRSFAKLKSMAETLQEEQFVSFIH